LDAKIEIIIETSKKTAEKEAKEAEVSLNLVRVKSKFTRTKAGV